MRIALQSLTVVTAAWLAGATASFAQSQSEPPTPPAPAVQLSTANWRVASGYSWFGLRDIARTGRPVDASPLEWRGRGLTFEVAHTRTSVSRVHRLDVTAAMIGNFEYRSPLAGISRPASDRYRAIDGRYEYRRYPFDDVLVDGLDVGVGVQGLAEYTSLERNVSDSITANESSISVGPAVVVAARVRRWSGVQGELAWTNGARIARLHNRHSETEETSSTWGGGWITNLTILADIRLTRRTSLAVRYFSARDGLLASHRNAAVSHGSFSAGVTYAK